MKTAIRLVEPNPHTKYEVHLSRLPRWVTLMFALLAMVVLVWTVVLYAKYEPSILEIPKISQPHIPNVSAEISGRVEKALSPEVKQ